MIGYLIKRIIFLVIFLAAIIVMPFAAMIGMIIYFVVEGVRQVKSANEDLSLGFYGTFFFVIGGIAVMFMGLFIMDKITENPVWTELFAVVAFSATLIIGGRASINFVRTDRAYYFMNEVVEKLNATYPYLLITAGIVRIVIEVIRAFFSESLAVILNYADVCVMLGNAMFSVALLMYVVRTAHVFWENK